MIKSILPYKALGPRPSQEEEQTAMLVADCSCGPELRRGRAGQACARCGGVIGHHSLEA